MKYKAFQDWYHEASIKHLLLSEYQGNLVSPPFATERCKEYSQILIWNGKNVEFINLNLPPVTSKTNAIAKANGSLWFIPYGIYDDFNIVVELKNKEVKYHNIDRKGKGQFYSVATDGCRIFSFPLGYEQTSYGIYIENDVVNTIDFNKKEHVKAHMGCVYSNGKFWSMPRSDIPGYTDLVSFDGDKFEKFPIPNINHNVTRKYTDLIASNNKLYSLPFGETSGLNELVEFDIDTHEFVLYKIPGLDFAKKYNSFVLMGNKIIGLPYGDEHYNDSNLGIMFDTISKEIKQFDIGLYHGGKYRYRSGIEYNNQAFFFPSGTPSCPIIKIDQDLKIKKVYFENIMFGRPIIYNNLIAVIGYEISTENHFLYMFDKELDYKRIFLV